MEAGEHGGMVGGREPWGEEEEEEDPPVGCAAGRMGEPGLPVRASLPAFAGSLRAPLLFPHVSQNAHSHPSSIRSLPIWR